MHINATLRPVSRERVGRMLDWPNEEIVADHPKESPYRSALTRELVVYNNQFSPLERWEPVGFSVRAEWLFHLAASARPKSLCGTYRT
jgi:hypothetical protein